MCNVVQQQWLGTFCGAGFRAHGLSPDRGSFCAEAQAQDAVVLNLLWCYSALGWIWGSSIPVENLCLFAVMEGVLCSCFQ